jgi:hypothetical protein
LNPYPPPVDTEQDAVDTGLSCENFSKGVKGGLAPLTAACLEGRVRGSPGRPGRATGLLRTARLQSATDAWLRTLPLTSHPQLRPSAERHATNVASTRESPTDGAPSGPVRPLLAFPAQPRIFAEVPIQRCRERCPRCSPSDRDKIGPSDPLHDLSGGQRVAASLQDGDRSFKVGHASHCRSIALTMKA